MKLMKKKMIFAATAAFMAAAVFCRCTGGTGDIGRDCHTVQGNAGKDIQ